VEGTLAVARPAVNRPSRIGLSTACGQLCGQHVHPLPNHCGMSAAIARTALVHPVETLAQNFLRVQRAPPPCSTCPICLNLSARYRDRMSISRTRRRLAMLHTGHEASAAALDGVDDEAFAGACLANCYVLVAVLVAVRSGIAGPPQVAARSGR
jgi:hypothetical protein